MATTAAKQCRTSIRAPRPKPVVFDVTDATRESVVDLVARSEVLTARLERRGDSTYLVTA